MVKEITPWSTTPNLTLSAKEPDLSKAKEVTPVLMFGVLPPFVLHPQGLDLRPVDHTPPEEATADEKVEAEATADIDPKVETATSSATDNASSSGIDTSESGRQILVDPLTNLHPSSLPPNPEIHASAVKELSEEPPPFSVL